MAFFSFDQPIACLLIFFNWYDKVGLFFSFFFQYVFFPLDIYIYIFPVIRCIFSSSNYLLGFYRKGYYLIYIYIYIYIYTRVSVSVCKGCHIVQQWLPNRNSNPLLIVIFILCFRLTPLWQIEQSIVKTQTAGAIEYTNCISAVG